MNPAQQQRGFALALVIWVVAGLSVISAAVNQYATQAAVATRAVIERATAERDFSDARARLLFTLATSGVTLKGRRVGDKLLRLDDSVYATGPEHFVSLQDARGLFNLNSLRLSDGLLLLEACGIAASEAPALVDALADYVDADDLKRLNGAESTEYRHAKLALPANRPLMSVNELWRVFGWAKHRASWDRNGCDDWVAVTNEPGFNYATAPAAVLRAKGFASVVADALVAERRAGDGQVAVLANNISSFSLATSPFGSDALARAGSAYRVRHWHTSGASLQYWVFLSSLRPEPAWVLLDPVWGWAPGFAQRRSDQYFPTRTPTDLTEDALATTTSTPFR